MTVGDILRLINAWAPKEIAWERDATGLQCGDPGMRVRRVLVALDPTEAVIGEAVRARANLIVTHHPLLFRALQAVTPGTAEGRCVRLLNRHDIAMIAAHTNLDFTRGGTSFALAGVLGLADVEFLHRPYKISKKVVTFVPAAEVEGVAGAMAEAGAGHIGNYDLCSFRIEGTGTFRGNERSSPRAGRRGITEHVKEVRLEMLTPAWTVDAVVDALKAAHPYEEVAYEIYPTENRSAEFGMGVIGSLPRPVGLQEFLARAKRRLKAEGLRYAGDLRQHVRRIAVCGGSGSELIPEAARRGADVFVTADLKYHAFHGAAGRMAVVDAGHYETEAPVVPAVVEMLTRALRAAGERIPVSAAQRQSNPVHFL